MRRIWVLIVLALGCDADPPASIPAPVPARSADARPKAKPAPPAPVTTARAPTHTARPSPTAAPGPPVPPLELAVDPARRIENRIALTIRPADLRRLEAGKVKFRLAFPEVVINGARPARSEVKLRGRLSLEFPRKSFTVKLGESVVLRRGASERTLKRFYLSALATDRGYFRAAVCLDLLRRLKRFPLYTTFAEVRINGRSFGPYLLIERPVDALLKRGRAVLVVRRRQNRLDDGPVLAPKRTDLTGRDVLDRWDALLARVAQARGAVKRRALERGLDLPGLLTWVAFDLLVHNADAGQAWVVAHPRGRADVRFDLLPWDYDQAFAERVERDWPHPWMFRDRMPETELRREPVFAAYRARLRELAAWIEGPETRAVFEAVFRELAPYYAAPEVIANARRDRGGAVDLTALQAMMQREYAALVRRARSVRGR